MPGLSIIVSHTPNCDITISESLDRVKKINMIPNIEYVEDCIRGEDYLFYSCVPKFIQEKRLLKFDNLIIAFEGDFYNKEDLLNLVDKKQLSKIEIINLLYRKFGNSFVNKLNGEFVIVIYDLNTHEIAVTNDRFARLPFFYYCNKDFTILGSEKKNIICNLSSPEIDPLGILQVFAHSHNVLGRTFIKDIFSLSPANFLTFNKISISKTNYFNWIFASKSNINRADCIEQMSIAINKAIEIRIKDKDKIILLLSGGHDSRSIALAIPSSQREKCTAFTFGENNSFEIDIASKLCSILGYKFINRKVELMPSIQTAIGAWKSEFAVNASGHPYMATHKEFKTFGDYILLGLPGLDTLNGAYMSPRVVLSSYIPFYYSELIFGLYSKNLHSLQVLFNDQYLKEYYPLLKREFIKSFNEIKAVNRRDQYDIWFTVERQSQFSHMADLVEKDFFQFITPYTDTDLLKIFLSIPTKQRIYQQYSKDLLFKYYPEVRDVPYDTGRGLIKDNNSFRTYIAEYLRKKSDLNKYPKTSIWDYSKALRSDPYFSSIITNTISNSDELMRIFNLTKINTLINNHIIGKENNSSLIGTLLSFSFAYNFFVIFKKIEIPNEVIDYYKDFNIPF